MDNFFLDSLIALERYICLVLNVTHRIEIEHNITPVVNRVR